MTYAEHHRKEKEHARYLRRKEEGTLSSPSKSNYVKKGWNSKSVGRRVKKGQRSPNWKGGICINKKGYIQIYSPNHPKKDSHGYVMQHRLVMEDKLGRYLNSKEVVHHLDNTPTNNNLINLHLFDNRSEHVKHHRRLNNFVRENIKQTEMMI